MQQIELGSIGRRTSRIGLGCARLVGRSNLRRAAKLVETALDLGIRHFDVAPSYGMGTAEEVIGEIVGDDRDVTIATKVGVPRPAYSGRANVVRGIAKSVLNLARPIRATLLRAYRARAQAADRPRYDFSPSAIRRSLETSLNCLRRTSVDVFLAHEPHRHDLTPDVAAGFEALRDQGLITAYGVGIGAIGDRWERFGSIWQSCWPGPAASDYAPDMEYIWHGVVRTALEHRGGRPARPSAILRSVLEASPSSIVLVSASTPKRLRELVEDLAD
jgi:aryl-alcohol dehydrogenase-like predicted oxidoreductase